MKTKLINTILGGSPLAVALVTTAFLAVSLPALAQQPSPAEPKVLSNGADAKFTRVENIHGTRYIEIFLAARDAKTGNIVAACFNTMFTPNGIPGGPDEFKKLPEGWFLRTKILKQDLIEKPANGVATIMPDEFLNVYDKTGPGMTNYRP